MKENGPKISRQQKHKLKKDGKITDDTTAADLEDILASNTQSAPPDLRRALNQKKLDIMKLQEEKILIAMEKEKGQLVEVPRVLAAVSKNFSRVRAQLDGRLINDFCARMGGRPSDELALEMEKVLGEIYVELSKPLT